MRALPLLYAAGATLSLIAWGYLVYLAIDFGQSGRGGNGAAWGLLALAAVGAIACLFTGLMLCTRLLREVGIISSPTPSAASVPAARTDSPTDAPDTPTTGAPYETPDAPAPPAPPGGRRRA